MSTLLRSSLSPRRSEVFLWMTPPSSTALLPPRTVTTSRTLRRWWKGKSSGFALSALLLAGIADNPDKFLHLAFTRQTVPRLPRRRSTPPRTTKIMLQHNRHSCLFAINLGLLPYQQQMTIVFI